MKALNHKIQYLTLATLLTFGLTTNLAIAVQHISTWDTNWNEMTLIQSGNMVEGSYLYDDGKITGSLSKSPDGLIILIGWWKEAGNSKSCGPDNAWSGSLVFLFDANQSSFSGDWGSCASSPESLNATANSWHGTLRDGSLESTLTTQEINSVDNLSFTLEGEILTLQWGAIEGATGYQLLLGTSSSDYSSPIDLGNTTQLGPLDISGAPRGSYYLAIVAYNEIDTAAPSNEIMVTLHDQMIPQNLTYTLTEEGLSLTWDSVTDANGYILYFGNAPGEYPAHLDLGNTLQIGPIDITNILKGTYYIAVTSYDANRESHFSNEVSILLRSAGNPQTLSVSSYIDIVTSLSNDTLNSGLTDQLQPVLMALLGQPSSSCPMVDINFDLSSAESLDGLLQSLPKPSIINIDYGSGCTTDTGELMAGQTSLTVDDLAIDANTGNISAIFSMEVNNLSKDNITLGNGTLSGNLVANMENSSASGHIGMSNFLIPNGLQLSGGIDLQTLENKDLLLDVSITSDSNINAQLKLLVTANEDDSYTLNTQAPGTIDQYTVTIDSLFFNSELCEAYPIAGEILFSTSEQTQTVRFDDRCDGTYILE